MTHQVLIICGNAGVGKTTFGRKLAKEMGALLLDIDTVAERLVMAGLSALGHDPTDRDSAFYKQIYREPIHETLFAIAKDNVEFCPCIVVAPFTKERRDRRFLEQCAERLGAPVRILYLVCDESLRKTRIEGRGNPRDRLKLDTWNEYAAQGRDPEVLPFAHEKIDTTKS